jgi:Capsule assembly protein Wzi
LVPRPRLIRFDEVHLSSRSLSSTLLAIAAFLSIQTAFAQQPTQAVSLIQREDASASSSARRDDLAATAIEPVSELTPTTPDAGPGALPPQAGPVYTPAAPIRYLNASGSTYIPVDSWVYPAAWRLFSKGYIDSAYLGLRPWTRLSLAHILERSADKINDSDDDEARAIFQALQEEVDPDIEAVSSAKLGHAEIESLYTRPLGIAGTPLRDSFHVGQTIINDYGRPYESGFNDITGFSGRATARRFSLYFRGEYQHAPSATGYSIPVAQTLSGVDGVPYGLNQATIPQGPIASTNVFRIVEADIAYHLWGNEISFGKTDAWLGPGEGGAFAWSNNAENIYSFRIDDVEPFRIPLLSKITGPFRYDFFVGSLKGHTDPNEPWVHLEKISFKPTVNVEIGFSRTVIWGGQGHVPITVHSFLKSFFSVQNVSAEEKFSRNDPGARFSTFDFTYRLPFVRKWLTLYADSEAHDDVNPISAPRRAGIRSGLFLTQFPGAPKLDLRVEGVYTNTVANDGGQSDGRFMYWEVVQTQGYTNKGNIMGDWIGRESTGGQAWLTYHLSPSEWIQVNYRNAKAGKDFIPGAPNPTNPHAVPGGTTQNLIGVDVLKRLGEDTELNAWLQYEHWSAPLIAATAQSDTTAAVQITWHPHKWKVDF